MTFLGDEGRDVIVVYNILHGNLTLLGPTASVGGFFLGPIYYYLMAPFLWLFNYNPAGPAAMVGLFGVATVWLVYKIGSEFFNKTTGIFAAILYAISPIVIAYSRSSWNPNLMPFFSICTLYILYKAIKKNSTKLFIFSGILFGILMQLHYLATFLGVIILIYVFSIKIFFEEKKFLAVFKNYFYVFLGFLIGLSPFLAFEFRHNFPNIRSILNFIFNSGDTGSNSKFFAIISDVFFRLFSRLITKFPPPEQVSLQANFNIAVWYYLTLFLAILSVVIFLFQLYQKFQKKEKSFYGYYLLLVWFLIGVLLFGFYKKPIYDYYFGFMFPLPFLLVGNSISSFYRNISCFTKILGDKYELVLKTVMRLVSIVAFIVLVFLNLSGVPFRYPANKQMAQMEEISRFVFQKSEGKPFNFALITGGNSDHAYRYFFKLWKKDPITIQNTQIDPKRKTVTDQLLIVCETQCAPLGHPLWEVAGFGRAEIAGAWDVSVVKVYKLVHYKGN